MQVFVENAVIQSDTAVMRDFFNLLVMWSDAGTGWWWWAVDAWSRLLNVPYVLLDARRCLRTNDLLGGNALASPPYSRQPGAILGGGPLTNPGDGERQDGVLFMDQSMETKVYLLERDVQYFKLSLDQLSTTIRENHAEVTASIRDLTAALAVVNTDVIKNKGFVLGVAGLAGMAASVATVAAVLL